MALELDFELSISDCCDELQFCDTTCIIDQNAPALCCDGYGALGNPMISGIGKTTFNWTLPSGASYTNIDPGFLQGLPACYTLILTGGTTGNIAVAIGSLLVGFAAYNTTITQTAQDLVNSINSLTAGTGWLAYLGSTTETIVICKDVNGTPYNNLSVDVSLTGDLTTNWLAGDLTADGRNGTNCYNVQLGDLFLDPCSLENYPHWMDGVYEVTYIVYDLLNNEINRKTKKFFIDCNAKNCLKTLIKTLLQDCLDCEETDPRVVMLRSKLDAARNQFDECMYSCAQETIDSVNKQCKNFCLDCN